MPDDIFQSDAARQRVEQMLQSAIHPGQRKKISAVLDEAQRQGVAPSSLETPVTRMLNYGMGERTLLAGVREIVEQPHGELARAISEENREGVAEWSFQFNAPQVTDSKGKERPLSWKEIDAVVQGATVDGSPLHVGKDKYEHLDGRVFVMDPSGVVYPKGYTNVQSAARARGATREDFTAAWKAAEVGFKQEEATYKTPPAQPITEREKGLNKLAAAVMKEVPKENRKELNGPLRSFVGALNKRELAEAARDGRDPINPAEMKTVASLAVSQALTNPELEPKEAMRAQIKELKEQTREIRQGKEFKAVQQDLGQGMDR